MTTDDTSHLRSLIAAQRERAERLAEELHSLRIERDQTVAQRDHWRAQFDILLADQPMLPAITNENATLRERCKRLATMARGLQSMLAAELLK